MKDVVFIGNRINVIKVLINDSENFSFKKIYVVKNSVLHKYLQNIDLDYEIIECKSSDKKLIFNFLLTETYELLISNGCPFVLPIDKIKQNNPDVIALNTHPTYLPHLKGNTPLNGVIMMDYDFIGATTHYIDKGIDTGDIVYQEKIELTKDLDQGLIYMISFDLESSVFKKALQLLINNKYKYIGTQQIGEGSYFNRTEEVFRVNFEEDNTETIVKKINSVGIVELGSSVTIGDLTYILHNAEPILNSYILNKYENCECGIILYSYSDKLLIKTKDGIVKAAYVIH